MEAPCKFTRAQALQPRVHFLIRTQENPEFLLETIRTVETKFGDGIYNRKNINSWADHNNHVIKDIGFKNNFPLMFLYFREK